MSSMQKSAWYTCKALTECITQNDALFYEGVASCYELADMLQGRFSVMLYAERSDRDVKGIKTGGGVTSSFVVPTC